jgi:N-acetylglucosamine kinase-like BadF-type ATPase
MPIVMARFTLVKPLETFDFVYQPSIDKKQIATLARATSSIAARTSSFSDRVALARRM